MNLTINKLIANDIINYGMDQTSGFNYIVYMDTYLNEYDNESQKYILDNLDKIIDDISANENVADLVVDEKNGTKRIDMVFYWDSLMTPVEKIVCDNAKTLGIDLELDDIRDIANDILDDDAFNDDLVNKIKSYDNGKDLD